MKTEKLTRKMLIDKRLFQAGWNAELVREQAKQYCLNIQKDKDVPLPFCFYTNGNDLHWMNKQITSCKLSLYKL